MKFQGIIPPTLTAFHDDGSLDLEGTRWQINYVIEGGVHGVFPCGTAGEGPLLSFEEKVRVIAAVVKAADGRVPVLAGVGCPSTQETVELAQEAERMGADGVIVVTPYYYPTSDEGVLAHYRAVAEAVDLPVLVYHIPSCTGNWLPQGLIPKLAEIPGLVGVKDSSGDVDWLQSAMTSAPDWRFFVGSDALLYVAFSLRAHGAVSGIADIFPQLVVELYDAAQAGEWQEARELQVKVAAVRRAIKDGPYLSGIKAALRLLGHDIGDPRLPMVGMSDEQEERLRRRLVGLELIG
ncbi:MAG: 4-hydroxy-tetrahydrodipicolinate synthase [Chloroflexota bacterium]|nr:4-hydroxy-tetrahydrodipicolinate synthase [Chloroflexota bacterium]